MICVKSVIKVCEKDWNFQLLLYVKRKIFSKYIHKQTYILYFLNNLNS